MSMFKRSIFQTFLKTDSFPVWLLAFFFSKLCNFCWKMEANKYETFILFNVLECHTRCSNRQSWTKYQADYSNSERSLFNTKLDTVFSLLFSFSLYVYVRLLFVKTNSFWYHVTISYAQGRRKIWKCEGDHVKMWLA